MKKLLALVLGLIIGIALTITALGATGYINWKGTPEVINMNANLDKIEVKLSEFGEDIEYYETYTETLIKTIKEYEVSTNDRDKSIKELQEQVIERDIKINELIKELDNEQAYQDVKALDLRVTSILEKLN